VAAMVVVEINSDKNKISFMQALVMMLFNSKTNTYHPIYYLENWFPGPSDSEMNKNYIRYKSKGHHTTGFTNRNEAVKSINESLVEQIKSIGYTPNLELEADLSWNGDDVPIDNQIRDKK
jgi:hypothetical protein